MKQFLKNLKTNDLLFGALFLLLTFLPVNLEFILPDPLSSKFSFYFYFLWIPLISIGLCNYRGRRAAATTAFMFVIAILIFVVSYPHNPLMDFRQHILNQGKIAMVVASLISLTLQIYIHQRKIRLQEKTRVTHT